MENARDKPARGQRPWSWYLLHNSTRSLLTLHYSLRISCHLHSLETVGLFSEHVEIAGGRVEQSMLTLLPFSMPLPALQFFMAHLPPKQLEQESCFIFQDFWSFPIWNCPGRRKINKENFKEHIIKIDHIVQRSHFSHAFFPMHGDIGGPIVVENVHCVRSEEYLPFSTSWSFCVIIYNNQPNI